MFSRLVNAFIFLSVLTAFLYQRTYHFTPHVPIEEIEADGGKGIVIDDFGTVQEWFEYGVPGGEPVIYLHGGSLTGKFCKEFDQEAKDRGVWLICPSMPGFGGSSPLWRERSFHEAFSQELVKHLGLTTYHLAGGSFGTGNAGGVAAKYPEQIRSLSLVVPFWPAMDGHNPFAYPELVMRLVGYPIIDRLFQYYVFASMDPDTLITALTPENKKGIENGPLDDLITNLLRATKWHYEGPNSGNQILRNGGEEIFESKENFKQIENIQIFYGDKDVIANPQNAFFIKSNIIPHAKLVPQSGGHFDGYIGFGPMCDAMGIGGDQHLKN